jgi:hypothetical protein
MCSHDESSAASEAPQTNTALDTSLELLLARVVSLVLPMENLDSPLTLNLSCPYASCAKEVTTSREQLYG